METIFPQTTINFAPNPDYGGLYFWGQATNIFELTPGTFYTVEWDGEMYVCQASIMSLGAITGIGLGNKSIVGIGENTGEPFIFAYIQGSGNACIASGQETSHIAAIYVGESGILLKDFAGSDIEYADVRGVNLLQADGTEKIFTPGMPQTKTVSLDFSNGNMTVTPDSGFVLTGVEIQKPSTLVPENIVSGVKIAGVEGSFSGEGDSSGAMDKAVNFYDPFGNVIYAYTRAEAALLTDLPEGPAIDGFTFTGWSSTLAEIQEEKFFINVAPCYSKDGYDCAVLIVDVPEYDLSLTVCTSISNTTQRLTIDWGDGNKTTGVQGGSSTSSYTKTNAHTYTAPGIKYIAVYPTASGAWGLGSGYVSPHRTAVYSNSYSTQALYPTPDYALISMLLPKVDNDLSVYAIGNSRLKFIGSASVPYSIFTGGIEFNVYCCSSLENVAAHMTGVYLDSSYSFFGCSSLKRLKVNSTAVISSSNHKYIFNGCDRLSNLVLLGGFVPYSVNQNRVLTLDTTTVFSSSSGITDYRYGDGLIYVPENLIEDYKANAFYAPVVDCIRPLSEYPDF